MLFSGLKAAKLLFAGQYTGEKVKIILDRNVLGGACRLRSVMALKAWLWGGNRQQMMY